MSINTALVSQQNETKTDSGNTIRLPTLVSLLEKFRLLITNEIKNIYFVCVQHTLFTSASLIDNLLQLGASPKNVFFIGKHYSFCSEVFKTLVNMKIQCYENKPLHTFGMYREIFNESLEEIWIQVMERAHKEKITAIVVLDDGGRFMELLSKKDTGTIPIIGIEQTTIGLDWLSSDIVDKLFHAPLIDVATSAAKTHLESQLIADAIVDRTIKKMPQLDKIKCGIIGFGVIGRALSKKLSELGHSVLIYDLCDQKIQNKENFCTSIEAIVTKADCIFGCTGNDINGILSIFDQIKSDKVFISCSSEDKEFLTLLKYIDANTQKKPDNCLLDITHVLPNGSLIKILNGGFPINFDQSGESVPANKIQLTRGLLFGALIQAIDFIPNIKNVTCARIMLDPCIQKFVVQHWLQTNEIPESVKKSFLDTEWIKENSNGIYYDSPYYHILMDK